MARGRHGLRRARPARRPGCSNVLLLVSIRRPDLRPRGRLFIVALVLRLAGAALLGWIGWVHWVLWQHEGYKFIPTSGPFFLVDAIAAVLLAVALLAWPRPLVGLVVGGLHRLDHPRAGDQPDGRACSASTSRSRRTTSSRRWYSSAWPWSSCWPGR